MKTVMTVLITLGMLVLLGGAVLAQTGNDLFQQALVKERTEGNLPEAIKLYQTIVQKYSSDRKLAAKALFQIGQAYEKLGNAEARSAYDRVVRDYTDQPEAAKARARIRALGDTTSVAAATLARRHLWNSQNNMFFFGATSPDGRSLTCNATGDLGVRDVVTGITRQITNHRKGDPVKNPAYVTASRISPDGKRVAFAWNPRVSEPELRIIGIDGSKEEIVYRNSESDWIADLDWTRDGRQILAKVRTKNSSGQIAWISVADKTARILKTLPWTSLGRIALSPDTRHIAYDAGTGGGSNSRTIFVLSSDGSRETALTTGAGEEVFGWMPDGKALLFATNRRGSRELWAIRVVDGKPTGTPGLIHQDAAGIYEPLGITKNGSLFYLQIGVSGFANVATVDWTTGSVSAIKNVGEALIPDMGAAWSPNGRNLAFIAHRGSNLVKNRFIAIRSMETGEGRDLVLQGDITAVGLRWFPDGNSFLVNGGYAVDAKSGNIREFIRNSYGATWMPDGKSVVYETRDETGRANARLFLRDIESGVEREISLGAREDARPLFISFAVSPDGQQLAFIPAYSPQSMTLSVMPPYGGPSHHVLSGDRLSILGWTPDSRRIVYTKAGETWSVPIDGGEPARLQLTSSDIKGFSIHPDGRRILYTGSRQEREVWALENLIPVVENTLRAAK